MFSHTFVCNSDAFSFCCPSCATQRVPYRHSAVPSVFTPYVPLSVTLSVSPAIYTSLFVVTLATECELPNAPLIPTATAFGHNPCNSAAMDAGVAAIAAATAAGAVAIAVAVAVGEVAVAVDEEVRSVSVLLTPPKGGRAH